ncbi:MAG: sodium-dependent bicarbonate transport family permease [bacterium]
MNPVLSNLLAPPILFFFLGVFATLVRSDLEVPSPLPRLFSLYLLLSIGFRGGAELAHSDPEHSALALLAAVSLACLLPLWMFFVLRRRLPNADAAAVAATYGSVSAVTFVTASAFLERQHIQSSGFMVAALAVMESPAIVIGVILARRFGDNAALDWKHLLKDAFLNGSVVLLLGSLLIGSVTTTAGSDSVKPFISGLFPGMLCFFLLDMGMVAAKRLRTIREAGLFVILFALIAPLINAAIAMAVAWVMRLPEGDAFLLTTLAASASYIAVPATMRLAVPEARPSLYLPMALGITFPFNIVLGLPLYLSAIEYFWRK